MKSLILNILFHSDNTNALEDLGVESKMTDCEVREMTFFKINAISKFYDEKDNDREYCMIHANADEFICVDIYEDVMKLIEINL